MEAVERLPQRILRESRPRFDPTAIAAWLLPALLIGYLAFNNGGYDVIERSQAGMIVWWIVLVGTAVGALPVAGGTRAGRIMLVVLAAFAAWNALSLTWTESAERTATELGRVATYLGVFALALAVQGEGRWRYALSGVATGVGVVAAIAVLSRLEPSWFPENVAGQFLAGIEIERRLAYPLNYSSGMGALAAIGMPLLLAASSSSRTLVGQALAAAALPVLALALWLTTSSLSVPVAMIGVLAFLVLAPDRLPKLATLAIATAGSAILFAAVEQRDALDRGLPTDAALQEGDELLVIVLVVCAGVALLQTGIGLAVRYGRRPAALVISRRTAARTAAVGLVTALVLALAAGGPSWVSDRWDEFKGRGEDGSVAEVSRGSQLLDLSGSGRYQFYESAVDANATDPLVGIGPGTFEYWWSRNGLYSGFVRDAHSLYVETLAELGIVGLLLVGGFSLGVLGIGAWRAMRSPPELRLGLAAATAGCAAFIAAASVDWMWELGALPVIFMVLAAIAVAGGAEATQWRRRNAGRVALVVLSIGALLAIALPLAGSAKIRDSRVADQRGDYAGALNDARDAVSLQPYAATPRLQEALVLEQSGQFDAAAQAAQEATQKASTDWRTWLILSRLEARRGDSRAAVVAYREARSLNPRLGAP